MRRLPVAIRKLDKPTWPLFLDGMSRVITGKLAEIEVASLRLGVQVQAEWLPLFGIVYDAKNDLIEIYLDDVDHIVYTPQAVYVDDNSLWLSSLEIIDGDGAGHIIKLRDPLMLPAN